MCVRASSEEVCLPVDREHKPQSQISTGAHGREQPSSRRLQTLWQADDPRRHRITRFVRARSIVIFFHQMTLERVNRTTAGQLKLQQAAVVVVGAGGLGCPVLQYLAAAGIGKWIISCGLSPL